MPCDHSALCSRLSLLFHSPGKLRENSFVNIHLHAWTCTINQQLPLCNQIGIKLSCGTSCCSSSMCPAGGARELLLPSWNNYSCACARYWAWERCCYYAVLSEEIERLSLRRAQFTCLHVSDEQPRGLAGAVQSKGLNRVDWIACKGWHVRTLQSLGLLLAPNAKSGTITLPKHHG